MRLQTKLREDLATRLKEFRTATKLPLECIINTAVERFFDNPVVVFKYQDTTKAANPSTEEWDD